MCVCVCVCACVRVSAGDLFSKHPSQRQSLSLYSGDKQSLDTPESSHHSSRDLLLPRSDSLEEVAVSTFDNQIVALKTHSLLLEGQDKKEDQDAGMKQEGKARGDITANAQRGNAHGAADILANCERSYGKIEDKR